MCIMCPTTRSRLAAMFLRVALHPFLEFGAEMADQTLQRPGEGFTQCYDPEKSAGARQKGRRAVSRNWLTANSMAFNLLGQLLEHVDLTSASLAAFEPLHDLLRPLTTLPTRRALPAALMPVESGEP